MMAGNPNLLMDWHALSREEALSKLQATLQGLFSREAAERLVRHGRNVLPPPRKRQPFLHEIDAVELASGDIVFLASGDRVAG